MTTKKSPEEQRIQIARLCGWYNIWQGTKALYGRLHHSKEDGYVPDYFNDLNAMHKAIMWAFDTCLSFNPTMYVANLDKVIIGSKEYNNGEVADRFDFANATAAQRAEAFVLTMESDQ